MWGSGGEGQIPVLHPGVHALLPHMEQHQAHTLRHAQAMIQPVLPMLCNRGAYGAPLRTQCDAGATRMRPTCDADETQVRRTCDVDETHMRPKCDVGETQVRRTCDASETHVRRKCDVSATHMRLTCDVRATHVRPTCDFVRPTCDFPAKTAHNPQLPQLRPPAGRIPVTLCDKLPHALPLFCDSSFLGGQG